MLSINLSVNGYDNEGYSRSRSRSGCLLYSTVVGNLLEKGAITAGFHKEASKGL